MAVLILLNALFAVVALSVTRSIQIKMIRMDVHARSPGVFRSGELRRQS